MCAIGLQELRAQLKRAKEQKCFLFLLSLVAGCATGGGHLEMQRVSLTFGSLALQ